MRKTLTAIVILGLAATIANAAAHEDAVKARQSLMKSIADQTKILGVMAKSGSFDGDAAHAAAATMLEAANKIPAAFESDAMSDDTEALPKIWEDHAEFIKHAEGLQAAATLAGETTDMASLGAAMGEIGEACKACHTDFRKKKE